MKKITFIFAGFGLMLMFACSSQPQKQATTSSKTEYLPVEIVPAQITNITMNDSISKLLLIRGREIAGIAKVTLKQELKKAIKAGGREIPARGWEQLSLWQRSLRWTSYQLIRLALGLAGYGRRHDSP